MDRSLESYIHIEYRSKGIEDSSRQFGNLIVREQSEEHVFVTWNYIPVLIYKSVSEVKNWNVLSGKPGSLL